MPKRDSVHVQVHFLGNSILIMGKKKKKKFTLLYKYLLS